MRIGNASGFYGDRFTAWQEMLDGGELDYLTGDYLAELTMLILGRDRRKDPALGYARTFLRQMRQSLTSALDKGVRIVTNAGGLNPAGLADALTSIAPQARIGIVEGDDLGGPQLSRNAYLGAFGIAECLRAGADIVITGRVTDASLVVGPAIAHFDWSPTDLDALAGATVTGHILECGAQATGGNFAFFGELPDGGRRPGFPLAEIRADGSAVITKHPGTGGAVTRETITAQLLYEIGAPAYAGPDVVAHFDMIRLADDGPDRVLVSGVRGTPPPDTLKVGVNTLGGFRNTMTFVLCGLDIPAKAALVREQVTEAVGKDGLEFTLARTDRAGADTEEAASALLHVHIRDRDPERAGRAFSQAAVELALASYPGFTVTTPPGDATPYGVFTAEYVPQYSVEHVAVLPDRSRMPIPPPSRQEGALPDATRARKVPLLTAESPEGAPLGSQDTGRAPSYPTGGRRSTPLGTIVGARSGDKGGDANLGVWTRHERAFPWLRDFLTVDRLRVLLPETATLDVDRYELPNLNAVNFVIHGLLGQGVAASTRFDPQAKALGEWLRSRPVDIPADLLP